MSETVQTLITNFGVLLVAAMPMLALAFKWSADATDKITKLIGPLIAALALVAGSIFAIHSARTDVQAKQATRVEAARVLSTVPAEKHEAVKATMKLPAD